jgi:hypothetical protein
LLAVVVVDRHEVFAVVVVKTGSGRGSGVVGLLLRKDNSAILLRPMGDNKENMNEDGSSTTGITTTSVGFIIIVLVFIVVVLVLVLVLVLLLRL